jgi:hypothetical protein
MFHFTDESAIVKFLLNAQQGWRPVQFEVCIKDYWSGKDLTLEEAKSVLMDLSMAAIEKLEAVRAVQAIWNHLEIYCKFCCSENTDSGQAIKGNGLDLGLRFMHDIFNEMEVLVSSKKLLREKHIGILKILPKLCPQTEVCQLLVPQECFQKYSHYLNCDINLAPFEIIRFKGRGESDDHILEYNENNVVLTFSDSGARYIFPYTDQPIAFSLILNLFRVTQQALVNVSHKNVESQCKAFPNNVPEILRDMPQIKLICCLRNLYFDNQEDFHKFDNFAEFRDS